MLSKNKDRMILNQEIFLSQILNDKSKARFIQSDQFCFNGCDISVVDQVNTKYQKIKKILISHNKLKNLDGFEQFLSMKCLSIQFNQIEDVKEFEKIQNRDILTQLNVKGNPLELHPDYKMSLIELFPNLTKLDDLQINQEFRVLLLKSKQKLSKMLIPFFLYVDQQKLKIQNVYKKLKLNMQISQVDMDLVNKLKTSKIIDFNEFNHLQQIYEFLLKDQRPKDLRLCIQNLIWAIDQIDDLISKIQGIDRKRVQEFYKQTFDAILLNYESKYDKSLKQYLINRAINNKNTDLQQFVCDSEYSFKCILFEFYKIFPQQAEINGLVCMEQTQQKEELKLKDLHNFQNPFVGNFCALSPDNYSNQIYKFKENSVKRLNVFDIDDQNPEIMQNLQLSHFPVFIVNENYLNILIHITYDKIQQVNQLISQVMQIEKEKKDQYIKKVFNDNQINVYDEVSKLVTDPPKKMKKKINQASIHKKYQETLEKQNIIKNQSKLFHIFDQLLLKQKQMAMKKLKIFCQVNKKLISIQKIQEFFVKRMKKQFINAMKDKSQEYLNEQKQILLERSQQHYENILKRKSILAILKYIYQVKLNLKRSTKFQQKKLMHTYFQNLAKNALASKKNSLLIEISKLQTNEANYNSTTKNDFSHDFSAITLKKKPIKNQSFDNVLSHTHRCYFRKCGACLEQSATSLFFQ